jgi:hypothetical protein
MRHLAILLLLLLGVTLVVGLVMYGASRAPATKSSTSSYLLTVEGDVQTPNSRVVSSLSITFRNIITDQVYTARTWVSKSCSPQGLDYCMMVGHYVVNLQDQALYDISISYGGFGSCYGGRLSLFIPAATSVPIYWATPIDHDLGC